MSDMQSVVIEEGLLEILDEVFNNTLHARITNWNLEYEDRLLPTLQHVERRESVLLTCRRPALFYSLNWANKRIVDDFIEHAEYLLTIKMIFDDLRPPCLGFRYAAVLKELLIEGGELKTVCDRVVMMKMDYRMSTEDDDGEPSEAEFLIRLVRESY